MPQPCVLVGVSVIPKAAFECPGSTPVLDSNIDLDGDGGFGELERHVGKPGLSLSFVNAAHARVMGAEFDFYEASVLMDMTLERLVYDDDCAGVTLFVADAPDVPFKVVKRCFLTEDDACDGMSAMLKKHAAFRDGMDS